MEGNIIDNVCKRFLLPSHIAVGYAAVVFVNVNRLETTKKRLESLPFSAFLEMIIVILQYWVNPNDKLEFDDELSQDIRDLRTFFTSVKEATENFRNMCVEHILIPNFNDKCPVLVFKRLFKKILDVGGGLSNSKEVRNVFVDISEVIIDQSLEYGWTKDQLLAVLDSLDRSMALFQSWYPNTIKNRHINSLNRLMAGLMQCIQVLLKK